MRLVVTGWDEFQHYGKRNPPWIKLHRAVLDNPDLVALDDFSWRLLVSIWLIASEHQGEIKSDKDCASKLLAWRLRLPKDKKTALAITRSLQVLVANGFISLDSDDASGALAPCKHDARQRRGEESREERRGEESKQSSLALVPSGNGRTVEAITTRLAQVLAEVGAGTARRMSKDDMRRVAAELVFAYWAKKTGHDRALFDKDGREKRLVRHMRLSNDNVHELLYAVDGWFFDPTFQRMAEEGRKLDQIANIFTDRERVERLAGHCRGYREGEPHPMAVKYLGAQEATDG
jgi:hypothetical protein